MRITYGSIIHPMRQSFDAKTREMLSRQLRSRECIFVEVDRVDGPDAATRRPGITPGPVVQLGTFSKILVPGFRLAWSVSPSDVTRKMVISKQSVDLCTNAFTQYIAADLLAGGLIDKHLPQIISLYRGKRDIMLKAMDKHFPKEGTTWTKSFAKFSACSGNAAYDRASDPWVTFDPNGNAYAISLSA